MRRLRALSSYYRCAIDEHAFDNLDPQKAWMLGYLWADGSLLWPLHYAGHTIVVASVDQWIPQMFKDVLKSDGAIHEVQRGYLSQHRRNLFRFSPAGLRYLGPKLERMGMARLKPNRTPPIDFPQELVRDFIRGVFDADGYVAKDGRAEACISGHNPMLEWVKNYLDGQIRPASNHAKCLVLSNHSRRGVIDWYTYLYYPDCICLERKRLRFAEIQIRYSSCEGRQGGWAKEETSELIRCRQLGLPPRMILDRLQKKFSSSRTIGAVYGKLHKLGL